jgi:hypothetical protein
MHVYLEVYDLMWVFNKLFSNKKFNLIDILKRFWKNVCYVIIVYQCSFKLWNTENPEADLEGGVRPLKFAKHICYTTLFKQFSKQLFHEWLTRDL